MFDSWFIGIGGSLLLLMTAGIVYWLLDIGLFAMVGYVVAASIFFIRSGVLRSGSTNAADVYLTKGIEENRGTLDFLSDQFNWTLFFIILATAGVIWFNVWPHFFNKHFNYTYTKPVDNTVPNAKPTFSVVRNERVEERKRA